MTFQTFLITFISGDCAGHVKLDVLSSTDELIMSDARGHYHPGKWIAFQQNFCIQLATNFCQVTLIFTRVNILVNWYQSTHSLITNTTPDHCRYFATLATTKTSRSPNFVRLSPNVNFPILFDYHLSSFRPQLVKYGRIRLSGGFVPGGGRRGWNMGPPVNTGDRSFIGVHNY